MPHKGSKNMPTQCNATILPQYEMKKQMYDLQHEILTFGPRMGHDDTIDALAYACKYITIPTGIEGSKGAYRKRKPKPSLG